ncbi:hypothetical protein DTO271G3_7876 [Paecilomyces variotii]|nr:hypothetical protein DTO271G3_7876 [Paecilomyces variotii]
MAGYYWPIVAATVTVVISIAVPLLLAEVFPWRNLYRQRNAKLTVTTKSFQGKTVLITGANGAFGSRAASLIANRDVETLVLVDVKDCEGVKSKILADISGPNKPNILVWQVDMLSYSSCQALAKKARELKSLDHVLMTAGILAFKPRESPEGWESSIQVNFLSTALLALLLLPLLKSSPSNPAPPVLTFTTTFGVYPSSLTMSVPKTGSYLEHLNNTKDGMIQAHQYGRSKALSLYFARELASRISRAQERGMQKVTVNSADPGSAWTPLTNPNQAKLIPRLIMDFSARDPMTCATALVNGVSATEDTHGKIVIDYDLSPYPPFMERKSGRAAQQRVWQETRAEFEKKVPEVEAIYRVLDGE